METILCAIAGWLIGVFINRAADNLPARKNVVRRDAVRDVRNTPCIRF